MSLTRSEVQAEIEAARQKGDLWTEPRPFLDLDERMGKMVCGTMSGRRKASCRKQSTHVSYATFLEGCVATCDEHTHMNGEW